MAIATSNSVTTPVVNSSNGTLEDEFINGLVQGGSWVFSGPRDLTYAFNLNDDGTGTNTPEPGNTWTVNFSTAVTQALTAWSNVANINFQLVTSGTLYYESSADLTFTLTGDDLQSIPELSGAVALGVFPSPVFADTLFEQAEYPDAEGDVFFDNYHSVFSLIGEGGTGLTVMLHEIGHALGLKHPFDDGENAKPTFSSLSIPGFDSLKYTVMSGELTSASMAVHGFPSTPMPLDILAIQHIYGANTSYRSGDDVYVFENDGKVRTFWDAGGTDTFNFANLFTDNVIDLQEGGFSYYGTILGPLGNLGAAVAYDTVIENAVSGSGNDTIHGNAANNHLNGNGANDRIYGLTGNDTLLGGSGDDTIDGGAGIDLMQGGSGRDIYYVDFAQDIVEEVAEYGIDAVWSTASFQLGSNLENLILQGSERIDGEGNALDNMIVGNAASNRLSGHTGRDVLEGGAGDDVYVIDEGDYLPQTYFVIDGDPGDYITGGESFYGHAGTGTTNYYAVDTNDDDLVDFVSLIYSGNPLAAGYNWSLIFTTQNLGAGQELDAGIYANVARYTDEGPGQAGMDIYLSSRMNPWLTGSFTVTKASYDYSGSSPLLLEFEATFEQHSSGAVPGLTGKVVINGSATTAADSIIETEGGGRDAVISGVDFELPSNVESLVLTGSSGLSGSGNGLNNILSGNAGNNILDGASGADIIAGGPGNDTYVVDNSGDQVMELGNSGIDLIQSGVAYNLMQAWHVENLTLTGGSAINGFGNWMNNVITGNATVNLLEGDRGDDTISGGGGSDTLVGGLGDDVLVWDALDANVRGGEGTDMLRVDGGGVTLDLTAIANTLITDIEIINITGSGNNTLTLTMADVLAISSTTDVLRVDGNTGDVVNAGSGWVSGGSQVIGAQSYNSYALSGATLLVDADITVNLL